MDPVAVNTVMAALPALPAIPDKLARNLVTLPPELLGLCSTKRAPASTGTDPLGEFLLGRGDLFVAFEDEIEQRSRIVLLSVIAEIEKRNNAKAELLYAEIDRNPLFKGTAVPEDRSKMNVTFLLEDEGLAGKFDSAWKAAGISGLAGHRSVGGYRASIYNAMPIESVQVLVDVMKEVERSA